MSLDIISLAGLDRGRGTEHHATAPPRKGKKHRELMRRVADGEIIAGVAANCLDGGRRRLRWSGYLIVAPDGMLCWEPDSASISKRRATPSVWDRKVLRLDVLSRGRGFTGERYERVRLTVAGRAIATFAVFAEAGPWHQTLTLPPPSPR